MKQLTDAAADEEEFHEELLGPPGNPLRIPRGNFHFGILIFEFFTQWFQPMMLPVVLLTQGWIAAANKGFVPTKPGFFIRNVLLNEMFAYTPQFVALISQRPWAFIVATVALIFVIFRMLIIAGKYALYDPDDYAQLQSTLAHDIGDHLLLTTWKAPTAAIVRRELDLAYKRSGVDLAQHNFQLMDGRCMSAKDLFEAMVHNAMVKTPRRTSKIVEGMITCTSVTLAAYPVLAYMTYSDGKFNNAWDIAIIGLLSIQLIIFGGSVLLFLWVMVLHYWRFYRLRRALTFLIARSESSMKLDANQVSFTLSENVSAWVACRTASKFFGQTYELRIGYTSLCVLFVVGFLFLVLLQLAYNETNDVPTIVVSISLFVLISLFALGGLAFASRINAFDSQTLVVLARERCSMLCKRSERNRRKSIADATSSQYPMDDLDDVTEQLDAVSSLIEKQLDSEPARIMYIPARTELVTAFLSLLVSGLFVAVRVASTGSLLS